MDGTARAAGREWSAQTADKLYMENTLLRVAGALFCHDRKSAPTRTQTIELNRGVEDKNIIIRPDPKLEPDIFPVPLHEPSRIPQIGVEVRAAGNADSAARARRFVAGARGLRFIAVSRACSRIVGPPALFCHVEERPQRDPRPIVWPIETRPRPVLVGFIVFYRARSATTRPRWRMRARPTPSSGAPCQRHAKRPVQPQE